MLKMTYPAGMSPKGRVYTERRGAYFTDVMSRHSHSDDLLGTRLFAQNQQLAASNVAEK